MTRRSHGMTSGPAASNPSRRPAKPYALEKVRATARFGYALVGTQSITVSPKKWK